MCCFQSYSKTVLCPTNKTCVKYYTRYVSHKAILCTSLKFQWTVFYWGVNKPSVLASHWLQLISSCLLWFYNIWLPRLPNEYFQPLNSFSLLLYLPLLVFNSWMFIMLQSTLSQFICEMSTVHKYILASSRDSKVVIQVYIKLCKSNDQVCTPP